METMDESNLLLTKFIHFGCWSSGFCNINNPNNALSNVLKVLQDYLIKNPDIYCIIVSGDNYYPEKIKENGSKKKIFNLSNLVSGLNCLRTSSLDRNVYLLIGNHELDNNENMVDVNNNKIDECEILKTELNISNDLNFTLDNYLDSIILNLQINNTLLIMIDTTMYDIEENDLDFQCYKILIKNTNKNIDEKEITLSYIKENQRLRVENLLKKVIETKNIDFIKNICIFGHHPLCHSKYKNNEWKFNILNNDDAIHLFYTTIFEYVKKNTSNKINYYYLCADLHNYEYGIINMKKEDYEDDACMLIQQYIVGTGGSELDEIGNEQPKIFSKSLKNMNFHYEIIDSKEKYGFLDCSIMNGTMFFDFIEVNVDEINKNSKKQSQKKSKGGKQMTLRKTKKYKKYKK
jgi:hypothetical protein